MKRGGAAFGYRRYARVCAVMALYTAETSGLSIESALRQTHEWFETEDVQQEVFGDASPETTPAGDPVVLDRFLRFSRMLAEGVWEEKAEIDAALADAIPSYDFSRLAPVDRSLLRIAAWEIWNVPYIPPAVTVNEAVEIAKKYSTAESGKFVNGVLGTLLRRSPKAAWDAKNAPADPDGLPSEPEVPVVEPEPEPEVEVVEEGSAEAVEARRFGLWQIRDDD